MAGQLAGCGAAPAKEAAHEDLPMCEGEVLFGRPNENTGLSDAQCRPECSCGTLGWVPLEPSDAVTQSLRSWTLVDVVEPLNSDPYAAPVAPVDDDEVCGFVVMDAAARTYTLQSFPSQADAAAADALVTHFGPCGLCSSLADLVVYLAQNDLTAPVRQCGLDHLSGPMDAHMQCLMDLGFSEPCASIWYYNTVHTRTNCAQPCLAALSEPYHLPSGELNECLVCDETVSGPVFKAVAGRTRRNSGLANAMCRPCGEVQPLSHDYESRTR